MATNHFSVPKSFSSGDAAEWFKRFDICSAANKWSEETKALKLPTLLEGEALAIWLALDEDVQKEYDQVKAKMVKSLLPTEFLTLEQFHQRKLIPRENLCRFSSTTSRSFFSTQCQTSRRTFGASYCCINFW